MLHLLVLSGRQRITGVKIFKRYDALIIALELCGYTGACNIKNIRLWKMTCTVTKETAFVRCKAMHTNAIARLIGLLHIDFKASDVCSNLRHQSNGTFSDVLDMKQLLNVQLALADILIVNMNDARVRFKPFIKPLFSTII